jgi:hypothetical protein
VTETEAKQVSGMEELAASAQAGGKPIALAARATSLVIDTDLWRFASGLCQGGLVPKGLSNHPGAVCGIIQAGAEIGFPPMHSLTALTFVNGRLGIMGEASRGLVRARHALKPGTLIKLSLSAAAADLPAKPADWADDVTAIAWCWPAGSTEAVTYEFSVGDARRADLWNPSKPESPWRKYPDRMLMNRAWGFLFRDHFSELFSGLWTVEELRDIDPVAAARDVTPQPAHAGPGPGEQDPALAAIPSEVTEPEQKLPTTAGAPPVDVTDPASRPEQVPVGVEPPAEQPCTHPDGFAPSQDRLEPFCIHCGEVKRADPSQEPLL